MTLIGTEWEPVTWGGTVWEAPIELETFKPSDSQGLSHLRKQSLHILQKIYSYPHPLQYCFDFLFTEKSNPLFSLFSANPAVIFHEGYGRQGNSGVPKGYLVVASRVRTNQGR